MNAQRTKQLERLLNLVSEVENELEVMGEDIAAAVNNLECNDMEHLPVYRTLDSDRDNIEDAQSTVSDLWNALYAAAHG